MTVVINIASLRRAARAPGSSAFPFLAGFARKPVPGCCGQAPVGPDLKAAASIISRLPSDRLSAFKALLGADRVVLWTVRAARSVKLEL